MQPQRPLTHDPIEGQPNVIGDQTHIVDDRLCTIQGLRTKITRIILYKVRMHAESLTVNVNRSKS